MSELMEKFWDWLDGSADGFVLRPDAPPEAVEAYKEYCHIDEEAAAQGYIID